jgi:hypothetical protein
MTATGSYETREIEPIPSQQIDPWLYRLVVGILGGAILGTILLVGILSYAGKPGSDLIVGIASAAVGGLIGMLVPSPVRK